MHWKIGLLICVQAIIVAVDSAPRPHLQSSLDHEMPHFFEPKTHSSGQQLDAMDFDIKDLLINTLQKAGRDFPTMVFEDLPGNSEHKNTVDSLKERLFEPKPVEQKPVEPKPFVSKTFFFDLSKPSEIKSFELQPAVQNPVEGNPVEQKLVEINPEEKKPDEKKPEEKKPEEIVPVEPKPEIEPTPYQHPEKAMVERANRLDDDGIKIIIDDRDPVANVTYNILENVRKQTEERMKQYKEFLRTQSTTEKQSRDDTEQKSASGNVLPNDALDVMKPKNPLGILGLKRALEAMDKSVMEPKFANLRNKTSYYTKVSEGETITVSETEWFNAKGERVGVHRVTLDRKEVPKTATSSKLNFMEPF